MRLERVILVIISLWRLDLRQLVVVILSSTTSGVGVVFTIK
jgi:hypothetical protein